MRVLAIIPACEGSVDLPNRNIRIVNGRPLVYYVINNAKKSHYITDIIVTSNSETVLNIGKQMGVSAFQRSEKLSNPQVPLEDVVFDVLQNLPEACFDYVAVMQSISPNLKVETLDAAFELLIEKKYDTVISAKKLQRYYWSYSDNVPSPLFDKRLSKAERIPLFEETGAFLITNTFAKNVLIGSNTFLYELKDDEAVDVFNFGDLKLIEEMQNKKKVAFYVNGNNKRGIGHIYRALELADEFYSKPDIYYDINQTDVSVFGNTTHNLVAVNGIHELFKICEKKQYDIFINDILTTSIDYMIGLKSVLPNGKIINFEDDGEGQIKADLVFNALLSKNDLSNVFAGEKYYIANKMFMFYDPIPIRQTVKKMFVAFGGADPQNYSDRVLKIISREEYRNYEFVVVLGRAKQNIEQLLKYNSYENIEVLYDISNMPEIMTTCDVAITSRGRTGYELAMLGIPSIAMAQNPREEKHGFASNENGFTYIGLNPTDEIIENNLKMYLSLSKESRMRFHELLLSHDLRGGRKRVMGLINGL